MKPASPGHAACVATMMLAFILTAASCSGTSIASRAGPQVGVPGGQTADTVLALRAVPAGQLRTVGALMMCSEHTTHPIRISTVSTVPGSKNLEVVGFGTRPNPFLENKDALGNHAGTASSLGFHSKTVAVCGPPVKGPGGTAGQLAATSELAVTFRSTGPVGLTPAISVNYVIGGKTESYIVQYGVTLCTPAGAKSDRAQCH